MMGMANPLPPGMKQMNVRVPTEIHEEFRALSFETEEPVQEHALRAMTLYLAALKRQKERDSVTA